MIQVFNKVGKTMEKKLSIRLDEDTLSQLDEITKYCKKNFNSSSKKFAITTAINVLYILFAQNTNSFLDQLEKFKKYSKQEELDSQLQNISILLKSLADKQEDTQYVQLAIFNMLSQEDYDYDRTLLQSVMSTDTEYQKTKQYELLKDIANIRQKDVSKRKTLKHTRSGKNEHKK